MPRRPGSRWPPIRPCRRALRGLWSLARPIRCPSRWRCSPVMRAPCRLISSSQLRRPRMGERSSMSGAGRGPRPGAAARRPGLDLKNTCIAAPTRRCRPSVSWRWSASTGTRRVCSASGWPIRTCFRRSSTGWRARVCGPLILRACRDSAERCSDCWRRLPSSHAIRRLIQSRRWPAVPMSCPGCKPKSGRDSHLPGSWRRSTSCGRNICRPRWTKPVVRPARRAIGGPAVPERIRGCWPQGCNGSGNCGRS